MDKDNIVRLSTIANTQGLHSISLTDRYLLILNYCIDCGKDKNLSGKFASTIINNIYHIYYCFNIALEYYERQFGICKLYDKDNNLILIF